MELTNLVIRGFRCNKPGCTAEISDGYMNYGVGTDHYMALGELKGWTFWVGRSRRSYCPDHGPIFGSNLRQIHPRAT